MNENQINGAEFSGAASSSRLFATAQALARAIVSGTGAVYRSFSATISSTTTVSGFLRNQYNGLVLLASTVASEAVIAARVFRLRSLSALASYQTSITAELKRLRRIASVINYTTSIVANLKNQFGGLVLLAVSVVSPTNVISKLSRIRKILAQVQASFSVTANLSRVLQAASELLVEYNIIAILQNQYNGIITFAAGITQQTNVVARSAIVRVAKAIVSASTTITARLARTSKFAAVVTYTTLVTAVANPIKRMRAAVGYTTNVVGNLAVLSKVKALVSSTVDIIVSLKRNLSGKTQITQTTNVIADLTVSAYAPASPENTFVVPPDDVKYEVEEG